ncbi:MAG: hypothetical protein UZ22_OP11002000089 [Microgenomates bacterium OLB23]|nr:MAG: hypothetical protein UZ22_OP11002000089 [Microgenomates bacterium OLB23]
MNAPHKADVFRFSEYYVDLQKGDIRFSYEVINNNKETRFDEVWHIGDALSTTKLTAQDLAQTIQALHIIVGISYYKAFLPNHIETPSYTLTQSQAVFWNLVYTKGLGEFFYKNNLDFRNLVNFPFGQDVAIKPLDVAFTEKALILHGGGKDSLVTTEVVKASNTDYDLFCLNPKPLQYNVATHLNKQMLSIERTIDHKLIDLNIQGLVYNGHVPISTFYTFAAVLIAILHTHKYVIISSERSSSYGNVHYLGEDINHQWSKSEEAEDMFREYINTYISPNLTYFSMLRHLYEIAVVKKFIEYPEHFAVFSSSNHHFKNEHVSHKYAVGLLLPKNYFVFILMSAFLSKAQLIEIFGENLYARQEHIDVFKELLGLHRIKPFECVGTPEETIVAMYRAFKRGEYNESPVMNMFAAEILNKSTNLDAINQQVFSIGNSSHIPAKFRDYIL